MRLEVDVAVAKVGKYASAESGDTVEIVERPHGGFSIVVADGQRSGKSAKAISNLVARKVISLIAEGVRDGAVARAAHDYLRTQRSGQVSCELTIVSVDMATRTLVLSRNARCPSLLRQGSDVIWFDDASEAIGIHRNTKPQIAEIDLAPQLTLVVVTDGVWSAGSLTGSSVLDLPVLLAAVDGGQGANAAVTADALLDVAVQLEHSRPRDDATVLVVKVCEAHSSDEARRLRMTAPL
ncbi:MAG: SpoIIE family protein phosphatase [Caldilinea sp.]|uniref:PP2C family protein-serine/threonine phosphatase n=1 Tax=Caldilinea sp. TaxID=2293560 RepID=UPI002BF0B80F|nr:SpoIIE family protein phosphatase [Anaerolineales bacterium]HQY90970.1 SpoIIE family protein phosphatase [Caldilinea sp.]